MVNIWAEVREEAKKRQAARRRSLRETMRILDFILAGVERRGMVDFLKARSFA
jgi:hypothetical protein